MQFTIKHTRTHIRDVIYATHTRTHTQVPEKKDKCVKLAGI